MSFVDDIGLLSMPVPNNIMKIVESYKNHDYEWWARMVAERILNHSALSGDLRKHAMFVHQQIIDELVPIFKAYVVHEKKSMAETSTHFDKPLQVISHLDRCLQSVLSIDENQWTVTHFQSEDWQEYVKKEIANVLATFANKERLWFAEDNKTHAGAAAYYNRYYGREV